MSELHGNHPLEAGDARPSIDGWLEAILERVVERVSQRLNASAFAQESPDGLRPRLLTVEQAASYLGRTKEAVQHMIHAGKLPTVRSDRRVFLDRQDLDQWIAEHKSH